jgi:hypothetical protein
MKPHLLPTIPYENLAKHGTILDMKATTYRESIRSQTRSLVSFQVNIIAGNKHNAVLRTSKQMPIADIFCYSQHAPLLRNKTTNTTNAFNSRITARQSNMILGATICSNQVYKPRHSRLLPFFSSPTLY